MFKYIWQRAMERRNIESNGRPLFLYSDEAHFFLHPFDAEYLSTARSSRIATVYISQNIANYQINMGGGAKSEHRVKALLNVMGSKIFHANADIDTNNYASDLIGQAYTERASAATTVAGQFSNTNTVSYELEKMVRPETFAGLKTGGPKNDFLVEGYIHRQGTPFPDGWNFRKITFQQRSNKL